MSSSMRSLSPPHGRGQPLVSFSGLERGQGRQGAVADRSRRRCGERVCICTLPAGPGTGPSPPVCRARRVVTPRPIARRSGHRLARCARVGARGHDGHAGGRVGAERPDRGQVNSRVAKLAVVVAVRAGVRELQSLQSLDVRSTGSATPERRSRPSSVPTSPRGVPRHASARTREALREQAVRRGNHGPNRWRRSVA